MTDTAVKANLLGMTKPQLEEFFESIGEKRFRAGQVMQWIHHFGAVEFSAMTNVGKALREKLEAVAEIRPPEIVSQDISADGTRKWVVRVASGSCVETVYIPQGGRGTLCVSSQAGCALDCSFCSTGKQGFNSDLTSAEIIGQVWIANQSFGTIPGKIDRAITNVVMMGMGEPLLNFDNVVRAMNVMRDDLGFGLANKRVTLSTAGLVPLIDRLSEVCDVSLAVSLHAPNDELRTELVPLNKRYPIAELLAACARYAAKRPRTSITFEYTMMRDVNDSPELARQLVKLMRRLPAKVNLIPFNPFPGTGYRRSEPDVIAAFQKILLEAGVLTMLRRTRGDDIDAACGQLKGQVLDRTRRQAEFRKRIEEATAHAA